jgi:hypothetical protein
MAYVRIISPDVRIVDDLAFVDICIFHQLALLLNCRSDGVIVCCGVVGYLRSYRRGILRGDVARSLSISSSGSERSKSTEEDERRSLSPASTSLAPVCGDIVLDLGSPDAAVDLDPSKDKGRQA